MERELKLKILEAVKSGLPVSLAMRASQFTVLFDKKDHYQTALEGGEIFSRKEGDLLIRHFPSIFISHVQGITFDKPE
jgi:hypothetical protein